MKEFINKYVKICPKTGKFRGFRTVKGLSCFILPFIGFAALLWIILRVISKPSRINYPCVKAAMPFAAGFIQNLTVFLISLFAFTRIKKSFPKNQYVLAALLVTFTIGGTYFSDNNPELNNQYPTIYQNPNEPVGEAKGIFPGRVVWVHNPDATNENCDPMEEGNSYFEPKNNNQDVIDQMLSQAIQSLTGKTSDSEAWDAIFKFHNNTRGKGEVGYQAGEKVFIKMNATSAWSGNYNDDDLTKVYEGWWGNVNRYYGLSESSPAFILSVLRQLVNNANVAQEDIYIGDPMKFIYQHIYEYLRAEFPNVHYLDHTGHTNLGRELAVKGTTPLIKYSDRGTVLVSNGNPVYEDRLYKIYEEMEYMLNLPQMKGHVRGGVTMFAKNHFGSHTRDGANHLHNGLMKPGETGLTTRPGYGLYRVQVDLMGHEILGKKNLVYLMDALWSTDHELNPPTKFQSEPFNNDWTSSIFASFDPVAIESVGYDFIRTEFTKERYPSSYENVVDVIQMEGVCDYLEQAADSANWPEGIQYDPENDGTILGSLGVHEHWNNSVDKQYSRDLDTTAKGIELIKLGKVTSVQHSPVAMDFKLNQNYPNPFNPATTISFNLNKSAQVKLSIYDALGRLVKVLLNDQLSEGHHNIEWNSTNSSGASVGSGVYIYKITVEAENKLFSQSKKMILIK
ncbi:MAG: hypothetical protein A2000_08800 [Ignavibacteria bacterium GWB2_36_8]|nr:MAG: hypothetical protein A2000_08800 [Ignavibacteria bacterium GWB2_36_8]OGU48461.1 MAG: hypothetical protein A2080_06975 [Ignavibacteria bacterium GWC2_36_12]